MGWLVAGEWKTDWYPTEKTGGAFVRPDASFRETLGTDSPFPPASGRYHLYVSLACPWAHRVLIVRQLKGLGRAIGVSVVNPLMFDQGWSFAPGSGVVVDPHEGVSHLKELYRLAKPDYTGRVTVPLLWDPTQRRIVNNESSELMRVFNNQLNDFATSPTLDLHPAPLRDAIAEVNAWVYPQINNGVYRAGFATSQSAYDAAVTDVFAGLERAEALLAQRPYLAGEFITEADWRLWTTLIRFDAVYHVHFKCSRKRIVDYPNLWAYTRQLYNVPGIAETTDFEHIVEHYYRSHPTINPHGVVPVRTALDFTEAHNRGPARFYHLPD